MHLSLEEKEEERRIRILMSVILLAVTCCTCLRRLCTLISGFRRDVDKICALLGYYAASCDNCLPTFRDNVSVPYSRVKSPIRKERKTTNYNADSGKCARGSNLIKFKRV
jgi:hypothetical protein